MDRRAIILPGLLLPFILSGCVTPAARLYSDAELSTVSRACGLAEGEVLQEEEEPRLLFLFSPGASPRQRHCVARWSKRHGLHLAYIEGVDRAPE
ncbi:MAG: hypothetical protein JOZ90_02310 [Alphaproteobacteria bacterium]|nr:hypothetical protein [Alphaproteobacteria bacterium]MBV9371181.1 hypothetical protein [Alphaproteobacteria bacterium]MBV9899911.1 hypothetical protein [Alphaproteobacteria bacterium]